MCRRETEKRNQDRAESGGARDAPASSGREESEEELAGRTCDRASRNGTGAAPPTQREPLGRNHRVLDVRGAVCRGESRGRVVTEDRVRRRVLDEASADVDPRPQAAVARGDEIEIAVGVEIGGAYFVDRRGGPGSPGLIGGVPPGGRRDW